MIQVVRHVALCIAVAGILWFVGRFLWFAFSHPELTQTQVLLARWKDALWAVIIAMGSAHLWGDRA